MSIIHHATIALNVTPVYSEMVMRDTDALCYFLCECIARELALCWYAVFRIDGGDSPEVADSLEVVTQRLYRLIKTWRDTEVFDLIRSSVVAMLHHMVQEHSKPKVEQGSCVTLLCGMLLWPRPAQPTWQQSLHNNNHRILLGLIWHLFKAPDLAPYLAGLARRRPH